MEVLASVIDTIFRPMKDFFARTFAYVMSCEEYTNTVEYEYDELKSIRDDIQKAVEAAELRRMEPTYQVKQWIDSVTKQEDEIEDLMRDYQVSPDDVISTYRLSKRMDNKISELRNLKKTCVFSKIAKELVPFCFEQVPSSSFVVGADKLLAELEELMGNSETGLIGIFGMAGAGKTTLLTKFNNDFLSKNSAIRLVVYIDVTRDYDLGSIQNIIGGRLGIMWDNKTPKERSSMLYNVLSKINFVLLLDDLWERLDLKTIGIPEPEKNSKSKVIIATRMEDVCDRMDVKRKIKMECLSWEDSWKLFEEKVGEALLCSNLEVQRFAKEITLKCGGLPLAIVTIGRALASKRTAEEWKHAITVLKYAPWQLLGVEGDLLCRLKDSYDNLSNDCLRNCLLYCSLFPEGFSILKERIIGYCIGEGFIDDSCMEMDDIYNKGHDLLGVLKASSLLEKGDDDDDDHIKMHPMIRAMALWIVSEFGKKESKWLVRAGLGFKEAPDYENRCQAERVSLMRNNIRELHKWPNCPNLMTLILQGNPKLYKICGGFFQFMPLLRVLDLSHTSLSELPSDIRYLTCLQYLDLYNTNIRNLPRAIESLSKLRFLMLSRMPLESIPSGVLSAFAKLQVLCMELSYGDWKVGPSIGLGIGLQELEDLMRLKVLDITIQTLSALNKLSRSRRLAGCTRNLLIKNCTRLVTIEIPSSDLWKDMTGLKRIWLANCANLEEIIIEANDLVNKSSINHNFDGLIFRGPNNVFYQELPFLPNLQNVILQGLLKARIVWKSGCLNNLSALYILYCSGLEWLIEEKEGEGIENGGANKRLIVFPNLKELYLHGLVNFKGFSSDKIRLNFPVLESFKVVQCPKFKRLAFDGDRLREIHCTVEWWEGLEWNEGEEDELKSAFLPLLKHI